MSLRSLFEWKTDVGIHTINGSMRGMSLVRFPQSTQNILNQGMAKLVDAKVNKYILYKNIDSNHFNLLSTESLLCGFDRM